MSEKLTTLSDLDFVNAEKLTQGMLGYILNGFFETLLQTNYIASYHILKKKGFTKYIFRVNSITIR